MESTFQNSVSDFDLNFLDHAPKKHLICNRVLKRSSISYLKTKVILTDSIIQKYNASKDLLDNTQRALLDSQEECKTICIDYRNCLEKCNQLENQIEEIQNANKLLEERCFTAETHHGALQSHINQLQVLVSEYETQIQGLKLEVKVFKDVPPVRQEKKSASIKENVILKNHICTLRDIIQKKKKVNKKVTCILEKYKDLKKSEDATDSEDESSDDDFEDAPPMFDDDDSTETLIVLPVPDTTKTIENEFDQIVAKDPPITRNNSVESENNDVRSVDTGRGSSLAFSDGEKTFHSPDYYMDDSPLNSVNIQSTEKAKSSRDGATSPMVRTPKCRDNYTSPIPRNVLHKDCATSPIPILRRSIGTSPIIFERGSVQIIRDVEKIERGSSPIKVLEICKSKNNKVKEFRDAAIDTKTLNTDSNKYCSHTSIRQEKDWLERNNSFTLTEHNQNDTEVEMILSQMKLHQQLITPIPPTPITMNRMSRKHTVSNFSDIPEENIFDSLGADGKTMSKKLDAVYNIVHSMKELLPHLFNTHATVRNSYDKKYVANNICNTNEDKSKSPKVVNKEILDKNDLVAVEENEFSTDYAVSDSRNSVLESVQDKNIEPALEHAEVSEDSDLMICDDDQSDDMFQIENQCDRVSPDLISQSNKTITIAKTTKYVPRKFKKKLTHLEKMRMKCIPKAKIKQSLAVKKLRYKPKKMVPLQKIVTPKRVSASDNAASLNPKEAYDKAVKVMAELKSVNGVKKIPTIVIEDIMLSSQKNINIENIINPNKVSQVLTFEDTNDPIDSNFITVDKDTSQGLQSKEGKQNAEVSRRSKEHSIEDNENSVSCDEVIAEPSDCDLDRQSNIHDSIVIQPDKHKSQNIDHSLDQPKKDKTLNTENCLDLQSKDPTSVNSEVSVDLPPQEIISPKTSETKKGRKTVKRVSISETEPIHCKRILRSRLSLKSNVSRTDVTSPTVVENNVTENNVTSTVDTLSEVNVHCDLNTTPLNRKRLRSRQSSDDATKSNNNNDVEDDDSSCKLPPPKRSAISLKESNDYVEVGIRKPTRNLRSSFRRDSETEKRATKPIIETVPVITNNDIETLDKYVVPNTRNKRISRCQPRRKMSSEDQIENIHSNDHTKTPETNEVPKFVADYDELNLFSSEITINEDLPITNKNTSEKEIIPKNSVICLMIEKYGVKSIKFFGKKPSDSVTNSICKKIENDIDHINGLHAPENKNAMIKLVSELRHLDIKEFMVGFVKYLRDPCRKSELYNVFANPPAPPLTKSEQVLLFIIADLRYNWENVDLVNDILDNIEYTLFNLNRSPDFNTIESMAHFYAILCRYYAMMSRLRLFVLDSLYCLQYKSVPLIKQCLDVWMHILPLAHMGMAKLPLVTCLVYLLHFYSCEDKLGRVLELRLTLQRKYFYNVSEWTETKLLDMFRTSIKEMRDDPVERKMLQLALTILAKRKGPKWCLKNIIKGMLQPLIENEKSTQKVKLFCILLLGQLLKPFPSDMKVHCEVIVTKLLDMLDTNPPQDIVETIFTTLIYLNKHNETRLLRYLMKWKPPKISSEFEEVLREYVKSKTVKVWKCLLRNCYRFP